MAIGNAVRALFLISHMSGSPLYVQACVSYRDSSASFDWFILARNFYFRIILSHFLRWMADLGPSESSVARKLRTTSDIICDPSVKFIGGGLHLQVTHHLSPRLPGHHLRAASLLVKESAEEQLLEFAELRFVQGNKDALGVLNISKLNQEVWLVLAGFLRSGCSGPHKTAQNLPNLRSSFLMKAVAEQVYILGMLVGHEIEEKVGMRGPIEGKQTKETSIVSFGH
ncbi:hypothetical protein BS47DRAFT_1197431 [Hydnum rufescens UP504]|uniref:Uncharacterized protein n=1 Tax=Hydnum rufescens UP504 TaxID=1448309 RepID=A0A9P6DV00_9AGAM|nr:hypothetical protein BS47DRAFT_1197431 [Hydnum rufescens UP504]